MPSSSSSVPVQEQSTELLAANKTNDAIFDEPTATRYARYKAEQERHLIKVNNKATDMKNKARFLFFPILILLVIGLIFYAIEPTASSSGNSAKLSRKARRRLEGLQREIEEIIPSDELKLEGEM